MRGCGRRRRRRLGLRGGSAPCLGLRLRLGSGSRLRLRSAPCLLRGGRRSRAVHGKFGDGQSGDELVGRLA